MLKDQLGGDFSTKLAGMIGASNSDTSKILAAGVPAILAGLSGAASNPGGADRVAQAIKGMDSGSFGDLGKLLAGGADGGALLSGLLGGNALDGVCMAIAKYTGLDVSLIKKALSYLTPIVLGAIGSTFKGGSINSSGITKLMSDQTNSITSAIPSGLSFAGINGLQSLAANVSSATQPLAAEASNQLGKILVPIALVAGLVCAAIFVLNNKSKDVKQGTKEAIKEVTKSSESLTKSAMAAKEKATEAIKDALAAPTAINSALTGAMDGVFSKLESITDAASADVALPALKESLGTIETFSKGLGALPAEGKSALVSLVKSQIEKLNPMLEKILAIPGIGDAVKQVLDQLKTKLEELAA
jgi:hypothetical protein